MQYINLYFSSLTDGLPWISFEVHKGFERFSEPWMKYSHRSSSISPRVSWRYYDLFTKCRQTYIARPYCTTTLSQSWQCRKSYGKFFTDNVDYPGCIVWPRKSYFAYHTTDLVCDSKSSHKVAAWTFFMARAHIPAVFLYFFRYICPSKWGAQKWGNVDGWHPFVEAALCISDSTGESRISPNISPITEEQTLHHWYRSLL